MAITYVAWARYERWNAAIASVVYSPERAGQPVYLDCEESVLEVIQGLAEPGSDNPAAMLLETVKDTLQFERGPAAVLKGHMDRLDRWHRGSMLEEPPALGFLAMLSLVAENMRHTEDMRAYNFYGRLAELLHLSPNQRDEFVTAYRDRRHGHAASAELWGSLNDWLEMMEGSRGLPTAKAIGHDHIGLPLSQALVRQVDRDRFSDLFVSQGLVPGSALPDSEMSMLIDEWMTRVPCPATNTLERIWSSHSTARTAIAEIACQILEAWDGSTPEGSASGAVEREIDSVRLKAAVRSFPSRRIELSMVAPGRALSDSEEVEVLDLDNHVIDIVEMVPLASGWLGVSASSVIDPVSFLEGHVRLRRAGQEQTLRRRARRLVPLRRDDLLQAYIECERVQLGEESIVLSHKGIAAKVASFLERVARPGFRQVGDLLGLPADWILFEGVQILSSAERDPLVDLGVLQPRAQSQVVLQGGLRLPGHLRKWLSARPPELRVSAEEGSKPTATIICTRPMTYPVPKDEHRSGADSVLLWDLAEDNLLDGDYDIQVRSDGELIASELLRLRSADNPARQIDVGPERIEHDPSANAFGLVATRSTSPHGFEAVTDKDGVLSGTSPPLVPPWWSARKNDHTSRGEVTVVRFPTGGPSCIETGAHYIDLPRALEGQTTIEGICRYCGLVKRYRTAPGRRRRRVGTEAAPVVQVSDLPPVRAEQDIDWAVAFDAVCHVGSGPISALDRITDQMEGSDLFGDAFARRLEVLGHLEIERGLSSLLGRSWQVNDPVVVGLPSGDVTIIGFRNERTMVAIEDELWSAGGTLDVHAGLRSPPAVRAGGLGPEGWERLASVIEAHSGRRARFVPDAATRLATALRPLSAVRQGLPTSATLAARSYEAWDPRTARFFSVGDAGGVGAFRLNSHVRAYVYRTETDLGAMRATLGDARIVKYLAALDNRSPLIGYDREQQVLYVPLGADLPGLYGRATVLASGLPPHENETEGILEYAEVPPELAGHLAKLLMS